jgi:hypothetical protein
MEGMEDTTMVVRIEEEMRVIRAKQIVTCADLSKKAAADAASAATVSAETQMRILANALKLLLKKLPLIPTQLLL